MTQETIYNKLSLFGLMLGLAGLCLTAVGCSSDDSDDELRTSSKHLVAFSTYINRTTKAAQEDVTSSNLGDFTVYAIGEGDMYMNNMLYKKGTYKDMNDQDINAWGPSEEVYWPAYALNFYAFTQPSTSSTTASIVANISADNITTSADKNSLTVTPAEELENQEDFVAAYLSNQTDPNLKDENASSILTLTFNHYLTQITLKASNKSKVYTVTVDGAKVANMAGVGTYTFDGNNMIASLDKQNTATSVDYVTTFDEKTLATDPVEVMTTGTDGTGRWYLVPQVVTPWLPATDSHNDAHGTYIALKVKITSQGGAKVFPVDDTEEGTAWMAVPVPVITDSNKMNFEMGHKYTITLNFFANSGAGYGDPEVSGSLRGSGIVKGKIQFSADVTTVGEETTVDIEL